MVGAVFVQDDVSRNDLYLAGTYRRTVPVSLGAIWENVFDWEHLPRLHAESFTSVRMVEYTRKGWCIEITTPGRGTQRVQTLRLTTSKQAKRYKVTTEAGPGAGTEIRVQLEARAPKSSGVFVQFMVPEANPERRAAIGTRFESLYAQLWDEDEAMMVRRSELLASPVLKTPEHVTPLNLGSYGNLVAQLPMTVPFGGGQWRLHLHDGVIEAFSAICPHWLGPLDDTPIHNGTVTCPWHGMIFDIKTRKCTNRRLGPLLAEPPVIDIRDGCVFLSMPVPGSTMAQREMSRSKAGQPELVTSLWTKPT